MRIEQEARVALTAPGFPTENNNCQKFARLISEKSLGGKPFGPVNPGTAKEAAEYLLAHGLAFRVSELAAHGGLQPGDLLYKTVGSGGAGHVGVNLDGNWVAENSSVHYKKSGYKDARGIRSLAAFGPFQVVGRLQPVIATPAEILFILNNQILQGATLRDGAIYAPAVNIAKCLGVENVALRPFLAGLGYAVTNTGDHRSDTSRFYVYAAPAGKSG